VNVRVSTAWKIEETQHSLSHTSQPNNFNFYRQALRQEIIEMFKSESPGKSRMAWHLKPRTIRQRFGIWLSGAYGCGMWENPVCACGVEGEIQALIRIFALFAEYRKGLFFVSKKLTVSPCSISCESHFLNRWSCVNGFKANSIGTRMASAVSFMVFSTNIRGRRLTK
jgi:hypothetical protein